MGETTTISWCDRTWSPWYGCTQVSMGERGACVGCYARQLSEIRHKRVIFGGPGRGEGTRDVRADSAWADPLRWNRQTPGDFVFPSMCDPFDNHPDLAEPRRRFFDLIRATPNLTWLLLTKRPGNIVSLLREAHPIPDDRVEASDRLVNLWPRNAAIGCTVVTQEEADRDIPKLLAAKAALKPAFAFVSMEPLLGPVDLRRWIPQGRLARRPSGEEFYAPHWYMTKCEHCGWVGSSEFCGSDSVGDDSDVYCPSCHRSILGDGYPALDWVIAGGETDQGQHKARPSHPQSFRDLRDQCAAAGVPFHFKQWGEYTPSRYDDDDRPDFAPELIMARNGAIDRRPPPFAPDPIGGPQPRWAQLARIGKKAAGRLLDGVAHDARPAVSAALNPQREGSL